MDALEELRQMHVEAKAAFARIESAGANEREGLRQQLQPELELHERIEETFVYDPVAAEAGPSDPVLADWETEHEQQVQEADAVMAQIGELDSGTDAWLVQVTALKNTLAQHIAHEENDIWPRIRTAWGQQKLDQAGQAVAASKTAAKSGSGVDDAVMEGSRWVGVESRA